jgi:hypothetical protein
MPKLFSLGENWAFMLTVNLQKDKKRKGSGISEKFEITVGFCQIAADFCSIGGKAA